MLDDKADEMRLDPRIPRGVLRRARRRRVANAALAGAVTVGLALGAFVGARELLESRTVGPPELRPGGTTEEFYPFIYPPTLQELEVTREQVAQGSMPMWTEPEGAAILFAVNVMGWDMDDVEVDVDEVGGEISASITNSTLDEVGGRAVRTILYIVRVPGPGPRMFAVLAAQAEGLELEPIGPDDNFGADGRIAFRGRVSDVPPDASVILSIDGRPGAPVLVSADRPFRVTADLPTAPSPSTLISVSLLARDGRSLALTSSRIATPVAGGAEAGASEPELALPRPVMDMRNAIRDAASLRDLGPLRSLIPGEGFTFTFGGEADPIRYWKRLESEGVPIFDHIFPAVLESEPGFDRGVFVWPAQALEDPAKWDAADIEALRRIHTETEIRSFPDAGTYLGWRLGIDEDGTWVFFVAGD